MQEANSTSFSAPKILLVVDDEKINRFLLKKMVEQDGYAVIEAADGKEAVEAVHHHSFIAVLMDIRMPNMNGLEASSIINKEFPLLPIIVVTAEPLDQIKEQGQFLGIEAFLNKPIHKVVLLETIKKAIETKKVS